MKRPIITSAVALLLTLFGSSCMKNQPSSPVDPAFAAYVSAFTSGIVSNQTAISIRLSDAHPDARVGAEIEADLFDLSPSVKGRAVWLDEYTIEYYPTSGLSSGQKYEVGFHLGEIIGVPKSLKTMEFSFQVMEQYLDVQFDGSEAYDPKNLRSQMIHALATTADHADNSAVESSVQAFQNGNPLNISWEHSPDEREHRFTIDSIARGDEASEVFIRWEKKKLTLKEDGEVKFRIPPLGEFSVVGVKVNTEPRQSVVIHFSDPLNDRQDLEGLAYFRPARALNLIRRASSIILIPQTRLLGSLTLHVSTAIENSMGYKLTKAYENKLEFASVKPAVELIGNGVIIPSSEGLHFPFKAVNISAVNVKIIKIFEDNIPQFLQANKLNGKSELRRIGQIVYKGEVELRSKGVVDKSTWNRYSLDLSRFIDVDPGAIYRVALSFDQKHSLFPCDDAGETASLDDEIDFPLPDPEIESFNGPGHGYYYNDYFHDYGSYRNYNYRERDNPCKPSYYMMGNRVVARNVLASDIGLIAKAGDNNALHVAVTDLRTTDPLNGVELEVYDFQNRLLAKSSSGLDGFAQIDLNKKPFLLIAKQGKQRGYLRLDDGSSLSLSMFNVGGQKTQEGVKGMIYGERGVWRPGDTLHLTFLLEDQQNSLPASHPILFELLTPQQQLFERKVITESTNGFFKLTTTTDKESPTGIWKARVKVGASVFERSVRVEAVKPNRLKIDLDFNTELLTASGDNSGNLNVKWLHGAEAPGLKTDVEMHLTAGHTTFEKFEGYSFDDPSRRFRSSEKMIYEGHLDGSGNATIAPEINVDNDAPGMLNARFKVRAYEPGGDFSVDRQIISYSPFTHYTGVRVPEGKGWNGALYSDEPISISVATVDESGTPVSRQGLKVEVYDVNWRWWWDARTDNELSRYVRNSSRYLVKSGTVNTVNGKGVFKLDFEERTYGRKFVRIYDPVSGHSCGQTFYVTYRGWWSDQNASNPAGAEMLTFTTDKDEYEVGEQVTIGLPASKIGRALVSVETGAGVLKQFWFELTGSANTFTIPVTKEMSPNAYVHLSLLQPHKNVLNDLPMRLYGVQPLKVFNKDAKLEPELKMPTELRPEKKFTVEVTEKQGRAMTYTLAVVDEGLLDLTRFKTPDPNAHFFAKEALGIRTWDLYDHVLGAQNADLAGLLAVGGDEYVESKDATSANRFKPMVRFLGPFELKAGHTGKHSIEMPNYIGSVRTMVVAAGNGSYGNAEVATPVKSPVMTLATLPRVVGPGEEIDLPVTVFSMDDKITEVKVDVQTEGKISVSGTSRQTVRFSKQGEKMAYFKLLTPQSLGACKVTVTARSGNEKSTTTIDLNVRASNPVVTNWQLFEIKPGEYWSGTLEYPGMKGTNSAIMEFSSIPSMALNKRLDYLIRYPHGCIEQTVSSVFPQLYLAELTDLNEQQKGEIQENVTVAIRKLTRFQLNSGGFAYWSGSDDASDWGTSYAGHFLLEAEKKGFFVPPTVMRKWKGYQLRTANQWLRGMTTNRRWSREHQQAYRLYTLALAGNPALGAMNRMRNLSDVSAQGKWQLALAYLAAGKTSTAKNLTKGLSTTVSGYRSSWYTYGGKGRDEAIILLALSELKRESDAKAQLAIITSRLRSNRWYSTQSTSWMLLAAAHYLNLGELDKSLNVEASVNGDVSDIRSESPVYRKEIRKVTGTSQAIRIHNRGASTLFVSMLSKGVPATGEETNTSENLNLNVSYEDLNGRVIDIGELEQGTDFVAVVTVKHPGDRVSYQDMALTQIFPSGWEIRNARMDAPEGEPVLSTKLFDYQDIRDDRIYTYFSLLRSKNKTFRIALHATYKGKFYLPAVECDAMYEGDVKAVHAGKWVHVK